MATSQLAIEPHVERTRLPHRIVGALIACGLMGGTLLAVGRTDYPDLHTILDTSMSLLALTTALLCLANTAMLYSQAPHDGGAMVAHPGKAVGYFVLLLSLMKIASSDMMERIRAEARRALERTEELHREYWSTAGGSR